MRVSGGTRSEYALSCVKENHQNDRTLLLLISFFFSDRGVQQTTTLFIFRLDVYTRHVLKPDDESAEAFQLNKKTTQRDHDKIYEISTRVKADSDISNHLMRQGRKTAMKIVAAGRASMVLGGSRRWRQKGLPRQWCRYRSPFRDQTSHYLVARRLLHVSGPGVALSPAPCRPRVTGGVLSLRYSSARVVRGRIGRHQTDGGGMRK